MWGHYVLTLYRSLTRHRLYAVLNVLGLAVGIAVFLVLWLDVRFETSFDRWIPRADSIYRLDATMTFPGRPPERIAQIPGVVAPLLKADYPQIDSFTRLIEDDERVSVGRQVDNERVYFVDPEFFRVLDLPLAERERTVALSAPGDLVISERLARKYFASTRVIGRRLTLSANGTDIAGRVAAVLRDLPANSHLKFDIITPITAAFQLANADELQSWGRLAGPTYIRFRGAAGARAVRSDLNAFIARRATGPDLATSLGPHPTTLMKLELTPLADVHFRDSGMSFTFQPGVDERIVVSLAAVGLLTLAIAILNYVNLATARSALRAREVAVRKVLGATRAALVVQFLAEAVIVTLVAVMIGVALAELALPGLNASGGSSLKLTYWGADGVLPPLLGLTALVGLVAGSYPALLLSGFQPAPVLAASRMPGSGKFAGRLRNGLVLLQFAAAIGFTICTFVLSAQARYLHDADRGFRRDGLIMVAGMASDDMAKRQAAIVDALRGAPGVTAVALSNQEPASTNIGLADASRPGGQGRKSTLLAEFTGPGYLQTYGVTVIAGRALDDQHRLDDFAGLDSKARATLSMNIMLNQTAVKALGFTGPADAIGRQVQINERANTVVGVLRDVRFLSPRAPVNAAFYRYYSHDVPNGIAAVRYQGVAADEIMPRLRAAWNRVAADQPFAAQTAETRLSDYYLPDQQRARLFTIGAVLAVAIACFGLYGLASFTTTRRVKEIGIRKTLGASTGDILWLLVGQFLRPVLLANLVAWPLAWLAMRAWLAGFDERITLSPGYFVGATALTLTIAIVTVVGQAFAVARAEPAKALRHE